MRAIPDSPPSWTLITGASSGIGLALALRCAAAGQRLLICARRPGPLEAAAQALRSHGSPEVRVVALDLSAAGAGSVLAAEAAGLRVDRLVANAGFGMSGAFLGADAELEAGMLRLSVDALLALIRPLAAAMAARRDGRILIVASTAAFQPGPFMAAYYAAKSFQYSFGMALREELRGSGVSVGVLCPGLTRTEFQGRAGVTDTPMIRNLAMSPEAVADAGFRGMENRSGLIVPGLANRLARWAARWLPLSWVVRAMGRAQRSRSPAEGSKSGRAG